MIMIILHHVIVRAMTPLPLALKVLGQNNLLNGLMTTSTIYSTLSGKLKLVLGANFNGE